VVAFTVRYPDDLRLKVSGALRDRGGGRQWRARNFQQNLRRWPERAVNGDEGTAGRDIQRGGKFQEVFPGLVPAANKERDGKGQTNPFTTF
jgi:hypothetical protein